MRSIDKLIQDIMSQRFLNSDPTRLIILSALIEKGVFSNIYRKKEVMQYVYRVYADYPECASAHPDERIKNISYYGVYDIKDIVDRALEEWDLYAQNKVLAHDESSIYLSLDNEDAVSAVMPTRMIIEQYMKKHFDFYFGIPEQISRDICYVDTDLETFGKSVFRRRVLEDMQYCPICEETSIDNLYGIHIVPTRLCLNEEALTDKNNGIILCKKHAESYLNEEFVFMENGFVRILKSCDIDKRAHLSIKVKNAQRREYLRQIDSHMR